MDQKICAEMKIEFNKKSIELLSLDSHTVIRLTPENSKLWFVMLMLVSMGMSPLPVKIMGRLNIRASSIKLGENLQWTVGKIQ